jgi:type IX secretion system PorP/SprF family membrane protein
LSRILTGFIAFVLVLVTNQEVRSQDTYNYTQFFVNPSLVNPAYTGIDGQPAAFLSYKKQWMGFEGAPTIGTLSIQAPLPSKLGVGLNFSNDKRGLLSTSAFMMSNSYYVPVAPETYVRFGFSLGAAWNKVDVNALNFGAIGDDVLTDLLSSNFTLLGNAGLAFQAKTFQIGASIPNIFQPAYLSKDAFTVSQVKPFESIILHTSYRYYFSQNKMAFEPTIMYRLNSSIPSQLEAGGVLHLNNVAWVGGSFKQHYGISAMLGLKPSRLSALGYSYTMKNVGINEMNSPSHEVQLAILFGVRDKKTPVYSFVNAEKPKGKKDPTHEKQQYYARNGNKNTTTGNKGKVKGSTTPTQRSGPRLGTSDPLAGNTQTNTTTPKNSKTKKDPVTTKSNQSTSNPTTVTTNPNQTKTNPTTVTTNPNQTTTNPTTVTTNPNQTTTNPTTVITNPNQTTTNPTTVTTNPNQTTTNPTTVTTNPNQTKTNPTTVTTNPNQTTTNPTTVTTNPNQTKTNPTTVTTNPNQTITNPTTVTTNPNQTTTNPTTVTTNPNQTTTNPTTVTTNPNQTKTNPTTVTTNPNQTTTNPNQTTTNPTTVTTNPNQTTTNPTTVTTNPNQTTTNPTTVTTNPNQPVVLTEEEQQKHEEDVLNRLEDHAGDPTETHDEEHPHAERHEFVKRGDHVSEMDLGDYVIVGVFRSEANAKRVSDGYRNLGFSEVDYGFQSGKNLWFVHIAGSDDIEEARTARNKYRKMKMFKDAWLLTVHQ